MCPPGHEGCASLAEIVEDVEPAEGEIVEYVPVDMTADERSYVFGRGYDMGRTSVEVEQRVDRTMRRIRLRQHALDALAVGAGYFLGLWLIEESKR